jgi:hypothetical protein
MKTIKAKRKPYIGITHDGEWEGFSSTTEPTRESEGERYAAVIGAFRTRRAQSWALKYGKNNPHFQHVRDAERLSQED